MTIAEMNRRFSSAEWYKEAERVVLDNQVELTDLNKEQLQEGYRADLQKIVPNYKSRSYANWKFNRNNKAGLGTPDLKKDGGFYEGFYVEITGENQYKVNSTDTKTGDLSTKYTPMIFGLTPRSAEDVGNRVIQPKFIQRIKKVLFGN